MKSYSPINVTEDGISMLVRDEHSFKASLPTDVARDGISMSLSDEHPINKATDDAKFYK